MINSGRLCAIRFRLTDLAALTYGCQHRLLVLDHSGRTIRRPSGDSCTLPRCGTPAGDDNQGVWQLKKPHWPNAADIVRDMDLSGKAAIVTGGGSGIGLETARALARAGATVTIASRDRGATAAAAASLNGSIGAERVIAAHLDLGSMPSIQRFAEDWGSRPLDLLIANAGIMACPFARTQQGFEMQMGVNHHGHFLLAHLLLPALQRAAPSRLVVLSSPAQRRGDVVLDDLHHRDRAYDPLEAYGQSKTADSLFALEFDRRFAARGVRAYAVFPGGIATRLLRHLDDELYAQMGAVPVDKRPAGALKTTEQGAATTVFAAVAPELAQLGGLHLSDCAVVRVGDAGGPVPHAVAPESATALWAVTERELGLA